MEDRQCNVCNVIEDEIHALCQCKKLLVLRDQMYETVVKKKKLDISKTDKEFLSIFTCGDTDIF